MFSIIKWKNIKNTGELGTNNFTCFSACLSQFASKHDFYRVYFCQREDHGGSSFRSVLKDFCDMARDKKRGGGAEFSVRGVVMLEESERDARNTR